MERLWRRCLPGRGSSFHVSLLHCLLLAAAGVQPATPPVPAGTRRAQVVQRLRRASLPAAALAPFRPPTHSRKSIQKPTCSNDFCHYNGVGVSHSALDMSSHVRAYASLVGLPCMGLNCQNTEMRVIPGDPEDSVMYQKVSATSTSPSDPHPCGSPMPADLTTFRTTDATMFLGNALPADQQQRIHDWIQEGAQNN